ncbi:hypothetical protein TNCV_1272081 [Trichonephila clavipes]|nr:hypothetical protein TNCV_1272081 [Trichonephila clavipes]
MLPNRQSKFETQEIYRGKGLDCAPVLSCNFQFCNPVFGKTPCGGLEPLTSLTLPPTSQEDLWLHSFLEYPMSRRHCTFSNIHAFPKIWTLPKHSSQRH